MQNTFANKRQFAYAVIILLLAVSFYLYEYLLQVSPSVMTQPLMRDFQLNAATVGAMVAFFYYAYSPMQLPGGLLYDRLGPRKVISLFMLICVLGAFLFAHAHSYAVAALGRFLMGVGGAVSFVGPLILAIRWFPEKYFAPISGLVQLLGAVGAVLGQVVLANLVAQHGWRLAMMYSALIGLVLVVLVALIVRDYPKDAKIPEQEKLGRGEWQNLKAIFTNKQTFIIALYSFFSWFPITVFAALWGVSFIANKFGVNTAHAAQMMAVVWLGVAIGSPLFGWWSEKMEVRNFPLSFAGLIGGVAAVLVIYFSIPMWLALIALFVFGVGTSGQALSFAVVRDMNKNSLVGTAMGFNNVAVVAGGALGQPLVGYLINLGWHGHMLNGVRLYSLSDYQQALVVIPLSFFMCFIFGKFLIEETHCQRVGASND